MNPEVSIIVPVYKTEKYLPKCINSIISQSFTKWELILVNDCSPDNSHEILSAYKKKDNRIKVINHAVNGGVCQARFTGMENATGKYVTFIDSDDWIPKNALQALYNVIEKEGSDFVAGDMMKVIDKHKIFNNRIKRPTKGKRTVRSISAPELFNKYFLNYFGVNLYPSYMCGKIYRMDTIRKASIKPTTFPMFEDMIFNLMLHPFLAKVSFIDDIVYYYRYGGGTSTSTPYFLETIKEQYLLKEEYIKKYNYTKATPYIKVELINCFYSHFHNLVLLDRLKYNKIEALIKEELEDVFYKKDVFEGIKISEKATALKSKNIPVILDIVRKSVKKYRPKFILKRLIFGILK